MCVSKNARLKVVVKLAGTMKYGQTKEIIKGSKTFIWSLWSNLFFGLVFTKTNTAGGVPVLTLN